MAAASPAIDTRNISSLPAMFFEQAERHSNRPFLWTKRDDRYKSLSWGEVRNQVIALANGLIDIGVSSGDRVMLIAENRPEWLISDIAIMSIGAVTVPAYTTNTAVNHLHILNNSGSRTAIVSNASLAKPLVTAAVEANHEVQVVLMHGEGMAIESEIDIKTWRDLISRGTGKPIPTSVGAARREDLCCIIYTSGTGGMPKGVMLSHGAILCNCYGATDLIETLGIENEVLLCFLPLAHAYEHLCGVFLPTALGAEIYYAERLETLSTNMLEARPTLMTAVPRLYETMRQRILQGLKRQGSARQRLFYAALEIGKKRYERPKDLTLYERFLDIFLERLVRDAMRKRFGGRLKAIISGGAPLNYGVGLFFTALGLPLLQGYGQTEAAPLISANPPERVKLHTVGVLVKGVEAKIAEDGEILVRGEMVMKGYWNDPDSTIATVNEKGWLHTGDVGHFDEDGYLEITDRKKDIIVNSSGETISPQRVEGVLCLEECIEQVMVFGDQRPYLTGLVVPTQDFVEKWAKAHDCLPELEILIANNDFKDDITKSVARACNNLRTFEKVRKHIISPHPFTSENGQLTPTLKIRRHAILREFQSDLEALY